MGASPSLKPSPKPANPKPKLGLRAWMERVLVECDRAAAGFDVDAVHDLRVALPRLSPHTRWCPRRRAQPGLYTRTMPA